MQMATGTGPRGSWGRAGRTPTRGGGELGLRPRGGAAAPARLDRAAAGDALTSRAFPPAAASAMGNIQKKLMGRSQGSRRSRRGRTPAPRSEQPGGLQETETAGSADSPRPGEPRAADGPSGLKSRGNQLFRGGQFAEAAAQYSAAIAQLEPAGRGPRRGHRGSGQKPASRGDRHGPRIPSR